MAAPGAVVIADEPSVMLCAVASPQSVLDNTAAAPRAVVADEPSAMLRAVAARQPSFGHAVAAPRVAVVVADESTTLDTVAAP